MRDQVWAWFKRSGPLLAFVLLIACLFETVGGTYWDKAWASKWFSLLALLSGWVAWKLGRKVNLSLLPAFLSLSLSCLWILYPAACTYRLQGAYTYMHVVYGAMMAMSAGLLTALALVLIEPRHLNWIENSVVLLCLSSVGVVFWHKYQGSTPYSLAGDLGNVSMLGSLIAVTFPVYCRALGRLALDERVTWFRYPLAIPPIVAIAMTHAMAPWIVLGAACLAYLISKPHFFKYAAWICLASLIAVCLLEIFHPLNDDGRISTWRLAIKAWRLEANPFLGFGPGTFKILFPAFQDKYTFIPWEHNGPHHNYFLWAHNDWIETLFEQGLVGLAAWIAVFATGLKKLFSSPPLFAALFAFGTMAFFNYPMNWAPSAYLALALAALAFTHDTNPPRPA